MYNGIIKKIYKEDNIKKIEEQINLLGTQEKNKMNAETFMNVRVLSTVVIALIMILFTSISYYIIPIVSIVYYHLFYYFAITKKIKDREQKLNSEALEFFEILTLTLENGSNLENSLEITCYNVNSELSTEFKKSLMEIRFGKSLNESLNDFKKRIPSETINNIILNITQTSVFGNSIIGTMNNQLEYLREKQIMEIKGQINKIPNKVSIISVIFIIPLILLIILGPFLLNIIG